MPFLELKDITQHEVLPGCRARFVHGDDMTVSYWNIEPGAVIPDHAHPHEQIGSIIEGTMELTVAGEMRVVTAGHVATIPSNIPHSVKAITECYVIDVFYPVREDYRKMG